MAAVAHPARPHLRRNSPLSISNGVHGFSADAPMLKRIDIDDSDSDDEPPPAIKFSKVTQALLDDAPVPSSPPKQEARAAAPPFARSVSTGRASAHTPSRGAGIRIIRKSSPAGANEGSRGNTPPRIVQIGNKGSTSAKRSVSMSGPHSQRFPAKREPTPTGDAKPEMITPAPAPRALRVRTRANSATSQDGLGSHGPSSSRPSSRNGARSAVEPSDENNAGELARSTSIHPGSETVARLGTSAAGRPRNPSNDPAPPPGSTRVKRAPIGTGSFLKSGPVRRGFRRRESDDNISPADEVHSGSASQIGRTRDAPQELSASKAGGSHSRSGSVNGRATSVEPVSVHDFGNKTAVSHDSRPSSQQASTHLSRGQLSGDSRPPSRNTTQGRQTSQEPPQLRRQRSIQQEDAPVADQAEPRPSIDQAHQKPLVEQRPPQRLPSLRGAQYRYVAPKIHTDASEDQENMPPLTFKRNKDQEFKHLGKPTVSVLSDDEKSKPRTVDETPVPVPAHLQQEQRKPLGAISGNTPHRTAPAPPPRMSVLDAATTTAGAGVTKSKKKRSHIVVNGKDLHPNG